jgi:hypothetical protein
MKQFTCKRSRVAPRVSGLVVSPALFVLCPGAAISFGLHLVIAKAVHERNAEIGITPVS